MSRCIVIREMENSLPGDCFTVDHIKQIPLERWDVDADAMLQVRFGAFLRHIEHFEPIFWGLSDNESEVMDPQQRKLMELAFQAAQGFDVSNAGVFVGVSSAEYHVSVELKNSVCCLTSPYTVTSAALSVIAGRISFHLGIRGPALAIDTACSSSLVAINVAFTTMEQGFTTRTFACGSNIILERQGFRIFQAANMLSDDGRSKALDSRSNGFSRGEALTCYLLDTFENAATEPLCVIRSVSVNQDGISSSLTAPNGPAQTALIVQALTLSKTQPEDVTHLMLHGTGTPLGDPIEVGAALNVYFQDSKSKCDSFASFSAVKSFFGHSEAAAGGVSLAAAVELYASRKIVSVLHLRDMNSNVKRLFDSKEQERKGRMKISRQASSHQQAAHQTAVAGVSSFASQGTNAHAILSFTEVECAYSMHKKSCHWSWKSIWVFPFMKAGMVPREIRLKSCEFEIRVRHSLETAFGTFVKVCLLTSILYIKQQESIDLTDSYLLQGMSNACNLLLSQNNGVVDDRFLVQSLVFESNIGITDQLSFDSILRLKFNSDFVQGSLIRHVDRSSFASGRLTAAAWHVREHGVQQNLRAKMGWVRRSQKIITDTFTAFTEMQGYLHYDLLLTKQLVAKRDCPRSHDRPGINLKSVRILSLGNIDSPSGCYQHVMDLNLKSSQMDMLDCTFDGINAALDGSGHFQYSHQTLLETASQQPAGEFPINIGSTAFKSKLSSGNTAEIAILSLGLLKQYVKDSGSRPRCELSRVTQPQSPVDHRYDVSLVSFHAMASCVSRESHLDYSTRSLLQGRLGTVCHVLQRDEVGTCTTRNSGPIEHWMVSGGTGGLGWLLCIWNMEQGRVVSCLSRTGRLQKSAVPTHRSLIIIHR
jgi:3-oxoacyl-(acyl-carrier-protein) synthase